MPVDFTNEMVWRLLRGIRYCTMANQAPDGTVDVRAMTFSCSPDLRGFYMLSPQNTKTMNQILKNPHSTLHVYSLSNNPDEFVQLTVKGTLRIHREAGDSRLKAGLLMLAEKLDMRATIQSDGIPDGCVLLELVAKNMNLSRYKDILHEMPATKITI